MGAILLKKGLRRWLRRSNGPEVELLVGVIGGERDAQLAIVVTRSRRHSSPSDHSSEPTDSPISAVNPSHEQAQQLGAPPGVTEVEISKSPLRGSSSSSPPTPGRVGPEGRRTMAKLVEELEAAEFVDATATTAGGRVSG